MKPYHNTIITHVEKPKLLTLIFMRCRMHNSGGSRIPGRNYKRILFTVMPYEGEVQDRVTARFYKNSAVKYMPLGVLSVAVCIPDKHEFALLDAASRGLTLDETIAEIEAFNPDIPGLSVVTYRAWAGDGVPV